MKLIARMATAACLASAALAAAAQSPYPSQLITLIVPFAAGSGTDIATRSLAKHLGDVLKVAVIVENKPGANGAIGAQAVARAKPDGYTLLIGSATTNAANFAFYPGKLGYESGSFEMVGGMAGSALALHVAASSPWKTVADLVATAKTAKAPGLSCGSGNAATQVACEVFRMRARVDMTTVPYRSNPQSLADLTGSQISMAFSDTAASQALVLGGKLRILAIAGEHRNATFPQVPTFGEQGVAGMQVTAWTGVFAPTGTPAAVIERLNSEINRWIDSPEATQLRAMSGSFALRMSTQESRAFSAAEVSRWAQYIKETNVKPE